MTDQPAIAFFLQELGTHRSDNVRLQQTCKRLITDLRDCYADNTVANLILRYRSAVKEYMQTHELPMVVLNEYLRIPQDIIQKRSENQAIFLDDKRTNAKKIHNPEKVIKFAFELLESSSYLDIGIGLMFLTGRRDSEIFKTATFTKTDKAFHVIFSGQLKKRANQENKPYEIPVLAHPDTIINALSKLRNMRDFSHLSVEKVHDTISKTVNERVKKHFMQFIGSCKPHDLRAIYLEIAYHLFVRRYISSQETYQLKGNYGTKILGHDIKSQGTVLSYEAYELADKSFGMPKEKGVGHE